MSSNQQPSLPDPMMQQSHQQPVAAIQSSSINNTPTATPPVTTSSGGNEAETKKRPFEEIASTANSAIDNPTNTSTGSFVRNPVGKDGEPLSEKKLRRLEKNRLSARECRRRKREATENMERQINLLEGENLRLRLQLQIGDEAQENHSKEQQKLTEGLDKLLKSGASESEIYAKIEEVRLMEMSKWDICIEHALTMSLFVSFIPKQYKEKFADYGRDRRSAIEFHLRNVERLLMPTQTTNVVLATLQGGSALAGTEGSGVEMPAAAEGSAPAVTASDNITKQAPEAAAALFDADPAATENQTVPPTPPKDSKALFRTLVNVLQVTPEQAVALKDSRFVAQEMDEILQETLSVLEELRSRLTQCGEDLETEFNNVRAILTPSQSAKFLVWVAQNKACMHMLNELWSKVYPSTHNTNGNNSDDGNGLESSP